MHIIDTIALRPYVFTFLLLYIIGCSLHLGVKRMLFFGIAGYAVAWLSEFSSIHTGFPYGFYYYTGATRGHELWVLGVPFMDSVSYVFLAYASFSLAMFLIAPVRRRGWTFYILESKKARRSLFTALLAAVLFVYLDIIIDPVALRGDRWFLGRIHGYPGGGVYFGVPLSNFGGWFLTGFVMILLLQGIDFLLDRMEMPDLYGPRYSWRYMFGPMLYFSVLAFNLAVTFFIGELLLGWSGIFILLLPGMLVFTLTRVKLTAADAGSEWETHIRDFPAVYGKRRRGRSLTDREAGRREQIS